jgi:Putative addiction module component
MSNAREHLDALLRLSPADRAAAADELWSSLDDGDEQDQGDLTLAHEEAWAAELVRRIERDAPGIPVDQALAEGRARLLARRRPEQK